MALKLARIVHCKIIITSSSDANLDAVSSLPGMDSIATINYVQNPAWDVETLKVNDRVGVDIVIENGGASSLLKSINAAAKLAIISQVSYLGAPRSTRS